MKWFDSLKGCIFLSVGVSILVTGAAWYSEEGRYLADEGVHQQMARILNDEVPVDVFRISFDAAGVQQDCSLASDKSVESAVVSHPPHATHLLGYIARERTGWEGAGVNPEQWVWSYQGNSKRVDAGAISEPDFRALVRQCVAAVRQQRRQAPAWTLTEDENRASWGIAPSKN